MAKKDYDYANSNVRTSTGGHLGSVNSDTGAFLKRKNHPTRSKGVEAENKRGNIVGPVRGKDISIKSKSSGFTKPLKIDNGFYGHYTVDGAVKSTGGRPDCCGGGK